MLSNKLAGRIWPNIPPATFEVGERAPLSHFQNEAKFGNSLPGEVSFAKRKGKIASLRNVWPCVAYNWRNGESTSDIFNLRAYKHK